ncbi:glycoside hydrolase family 13 protein [Allorhizocola rhizosphaerae]|uniref:glycoside hydrolase family 13 protein n=1 Tax=Allorhizocola rhizosphaerae TaxID=1872709 RepID=UPI000E3EBD0F|nr:glycoside hydrolase family 13 protein [Allorhizocola rhizosphaerae]
MSSSTTWIHDAVIYQIYPRSFADGNGDGIGDLAGIRARLGYLKTLGVDAIWFSPWYVSPMADAGYDVADYRDIDPLFGSLAEAETLIAEAHGLGLKVIVDIVPNHCSSAHPLFQAALRDPAAPERDLFYFRDNPANEWSSHFGGPAWSQAPDGSWYLHMFAPEQPDWNWDHPRVREEFDATLRFWLDRGVDGFRIDVADHLVKDLSAMDGYRNQEGVHEIYREWRKVAESYPQKGIFVGELWDPDPVSFARYLRPDELHTGFNFAFLACPWDAAMMREVITLTLSTHQPINAPATWVLSNHDVVRHVTRYGRPDTGHNFLPLLDGPPADLALGTRRARAAALLMLALPGCAYVYQGEELGLPEVEDLPTHVLQDPRWVRSGYTDRGRDGCRVPLPWSGTNPPFGFGPAGSTPWLPQPESWAKLTAEAQEDDPGSMLSLYRAALRLRRTLDGGPLEWLDSPEGVLAFKRGHHTCIINLSAETLPLDGDEHVLLKSIDEPGLPPDAAVWVKERVA